MPRHGVEEGLVSYRVNEEGTVLISRNDLLKVLEAVPEGAYIEVPQLVSSLMGYNGEVSLDD